MPHDPAAIVQVADALAEEYTAFDYGETAVVERGYATWGLKLADVTGIDLEIEDAKRLHVDFAIHSTAQEAEQVAIARAAMTSPIDVVIRKKFGLVDQEAATGRLQTEEIDRMMALTQAMHLKMMAKRLEGFSDAAWRNTELLAAPVKEHLRDLRQFTAVIRLTFRSLLRLEIELPPGELGN